MCLISYYNSSITKYTLICIIAHSESCFNITAQANIDSLAYSYSCQNNHSIKRNGTSGLATFKMPSVALQLAVSASK